MHILAAMGPPGGGRQVISDRLQSRFNVINMTFPDEGTIERIYGTMLLQHLANFDEGVKLVGKVVTDTTIGNKLYSSRKKYIFVILFNDIIK